jgi:hypothetical protein
MTLSVLDVSFESDVNYRLPGHLYVASSHSGPDQGGEGGVQTMGEEQGEMGGEM